MRFLKQTLRGTACIASLLAGAAAYATVPAVVMSDHQTLYSNLSGGVSRVSANARGDVFFADPFNHELLELPAGSTTPIVLLINTDSTTSTSGPNSVDVDSSGNVYFNNTYAGRVVKVPFVNGAYPTSVDASSATLKANTCSAGMTVDCVLPTLGALVGYFAQTSDTAFDAAGNFYFVDVNDSITNGAHNRIVELSASGTVSILIDNLTTASNAQLVSDAKGNLFYVNGTGLYSLPVGATSLTQVNSSTLSKPSGVSIDSYGDLVVSDSGNSRIVVIPNENGALSYTDQYLLAPQYSQNSVGFDSFGTIYYTGSSGGATTISALQTSIYNAPSLAVNSTTTSALVYASFNASVTFSSIYTHANGGTVSASVNTCVLGTTYTAGKSCALNTQVKPTRVGPVSGIIGVADASGIVQGEFALSTIGLGSAVAIDPGIASTVSSTFNTPAGVTVDRAGNIFVADTAANIVYEFVGGTGAPVSLGTGLVGPTGVAVDPSGDLFIADTGNSRVVEIPNFGSTLQSASQVTIAGTLSAPIAVATGLSDNLYIAQAGQLAVYAIRDIASNTLTSILSTSFAKPRSLAVDPSGNVFLADQATGTVNKIAAYTGTITTIASGLTTPTGLAADAAGNLFVADNGTAQVVRIPNTGGSLNYSNAVSLGTFTSPLGLAIDGSANIYISDPSIPALYKVTRTLGALGFGNVGLNTTSPELSAAIVNSGNATLTLGTPLYTASGDATHFAVTADTTCKAGNTLATAAGCIIAATFTPSAKGTLSELLALNASPTVATSPFQLTLTGTGTFLEPTSLAVATTTTGTLSYGETVSLTATLTPTAFNVSAATGTVTFYVNGTAQKPVTISNNTASIQTTSLTGGSNSIYAVYSGDVNYMGSTSPTVSLTVATATTTTTLAVTAAFNNPTSSLTGSSVKLTSVITPSVAGLLSGSVNFVSGTTTLGSAALTAQTDGTYQAALTTSTIPAGTYSITAVYPGNANYGGSNSPPVSLIVSAAGIQMTSSSSGLTSSKNSTGQVTLSVASVAGLTAPVTFACTGLPAYAVCRFTPAYISLTNSTSAIPVLPTSVGLAIQVDVNPGQPLPVVSSVRRSTDGRMLLAFLGLPLLCLLDKRRRLVRKSVITLGLLLSLTALVAMTGCGGNTASDITPNGVYPITVTATSSSANTNLTLNLTVAN